MSQRTFKFVSNGTNFTYDPPGDWGYSHGEDLQFQTTSGPFAIDFKAKDQFVHLNSPLAGNPTRIESTEIDGLHVAKGKVAADISDADRRALWRAHGRIATYNYQITLNPGSGSEMSDRSHNGTYCC